MVTAGVSVSEAIVPTESILEDIIRPDVIYAILYFVPESIAYSVIWYVPVSFTYPVFKIESR